MSDLVVDSVSPSGVDCGDGAVVDVWSDVGGGEVEPAGAVEGVFGGARGVAGGQQGVLVAVTAGAVEGEAPPADGVCVAQVQQLGPFTVGQFGLYVGEGSAVADVQALQLHTPGVGDLPRLEEVRHPSRDGFLQLVGE